jgi:D-alanyl-D-alanine carboxypeptidase
VFFTEYYELFLKTIKQFNKPIQMKQKLFSMILFMGIAFGTVFAQSINKPKLDSLFNILAEKNKAMGSVTISKNGTVLYSRAIGYCSITGDEKKPSTNLTKYRIGSISKMFTSTMIFQLIEEGKIKLTTTLDSYFPNLPNAKTITISNLLNHRSGLHNFTNDPEYQNWMTQPKTQDEMLAIIAKNKVDFQPNEKAAYSNTNFVILGYIIEKIDKQPYSKSLEKRIISRVKLSNTYIGGKTNIGNNESYSYQYMGQWIQAPETDMSIPGGAGSIVSTPTDLTQFIEALFSLKLVSQNSLNQMKTITDGFGMGMFQIPFSTKKAYGHNGGIDGFASNLAYFPEDNLALAYCTNGQAYPMNDILIGVLSICFDKAYSIPTFDSKQSVNLKTEDLDKYLGVYSTIQLPLKITITKDNTVLIAQATGQSSFRLDATETDKFKFDPAGIIMEFNPAKNEMTLKQGGGNFLFTKEK